MSNDQDTTLRGLLLTQWSFDLGAVMDWRNREPVGMLLCDLRVLDRCDPWTDTVPAPDPYGSKPVLRWTVIGGFTAVRLGDSHKIWLYTEDPEELPLDWPVAEDDDDDD